MALLIIYDYGSKIGYWLRGKFTKVGPDKGEVRKELNLCQKWSSLGGFVTKQSNRNFGDQLLSKVFIAFNMLWRSLPFIPL